MGLPDWILEAKEWINSVLFFMSPCSLTFMCPDLGIKPKQRMAGPRFRQVSFAVLQ